MAKYLCVQRVQLVTDGPIFEVGDPIEPNEEQAAILLNVGAIIGTPSQEVVEAPQIAATTNTATIPNTTETPTEESPAAPPSAPDTTGGVTP